MNSFSSIYYTKKIIRDLIIISITLLTLLFIITITLNNKLNDLLLQKDNLNNEIIKLNNLKNDLQFELNNLNLKKDQLKLLIENYKTNNEFKVTITAYTARRQETNNDPNNTAIMERPKPGWTIAVSHDLKFMLGKRVYIPGYGVRYVNDLMNSRYTKRIDILVSSVEEARRIGVRKGSIVLIETELLLEEFLKD